MVKKSITIQAVEDDDLSLKISKKNSDKKNNLQSLIKVLRPKVYITDSSTFKNLVQELTGNGNIGSTSSMSTPLILSPPPTIITSRPVEDQEQVVNNMMYNIEDYDFQESSPELSFDSSDHHFGVPIALDSLPEIMPQTLISGDHEFQSLDYNQMSDFPVQFEEMESWFLEMETNSVYNNNYYYDSYALQPVMGPEVCVFDYDLSAIM